MCLYSCCGCCKWGAQFYAMMGKAAVLRRRRYISTFFEMAMPVGAFLLLLVIWNEVQLQSQGNLFEVRTTISRQRDELRTGAWDGSNLQNYLSWCEESGFQFFVTSDQDSLASKAQELRDVMVAQTQPHVSDSTVQYIASEDDLESYATSSNYANTPYICGAVVLKEMMGGSAGLSFKYSIRMNASDSFQESYPQQIPSTREISNDLSLESFEQAWKYTGHGFLAVQNVVDAWIINGSLPATSEFLPFYPISYPLQPFPTPEYEDDIFVQIVAAVLGLFLTLAFIWPLQRITKSLVEEKENRIKELMFQMSLYPTAWFAAWLAIYAMFFAVSSLLITLLTSSNIYQNSSPGIIFLFYFLFSMAIFAFGFMASSIFQKANTAATMTTIGLLGSFFGYYALNSTSTKSLRALACISAPVCVGQGAVIISTFESNGLGMNPETFNVEVDNIDMGTVFGMLVADFFLYIIIGLYLEKVWPSEFGVPHAPWFFLLPSYWCPGRNRNNARQDERKLPEIYEPDPRKPLPAGLKLGLEVINLRKEFESDHGAFVAVDNLSVDMFRDQVFALLGHNGAGKTTTINMLTGMYTTTSGDAVLTTKEGDKYCVSTDLHRMQGVLGVCPQHDVLFPDLTVAEHLRIMARVKGVPNAEIEDALAEIIALVGITEKVNSQTQGLSGGQKRKLSISMALIGNSELVFLDEPTSGVDPYSRRSMWEVIRRAKKDRVIVLTTHFMDEADTLGDRIGIMEHGTLACCASSLHLKNAYGVGYTFSVSLAENGDAKAVRNLVRKFVPEARTRTSAGEVQCRLPLASSSEFPAMMKALDKEMKTLGIQSFGISVTTLEEVFLKVGAATKEILDEEEEIGDDQGGDAPEEKKLLATGDLKNAEQRASGANEVEMQNLEKRIAVDSKTDKNNNVKALGAEELAVLNAVEMGDSGLFRQLHALLLKRFWNYRRDRRGLLWTIFYPLAILTVTIGLMQLGIEGDFPTLDLTPSMFNSPNYIPVNGIAWGYLESQFDGSSAHFINASSTSCPDGLTDSVYPIPFENITTPNAAKNMQYVLSCTWSDQFKESKYLALVGYDTNRTFSGQAYGQVDTGLRGSAPGDEEEYHFDAPGNSTNNRSPFWAFYNETGYHSPGVLLNMINNAVGRNYTGSTSFNIMTQNDPLPLTDNEKLLSANIVGLCISIGFSMIPAFFVYFIVTERVIGAKHQQIISGVDLFAYWFSSLLWDFVTGLLPGFLSFFIFLGYSLDPLTGENAGAMMLNVILYLLSITTFTYVASFLFSNANTAQNVMLLIYITFGSILAIASDILDIIGSTRDINKKLKFVYRLSPSFCFAEVVISLMRRQRNGANDGIWDNDVTGYPMIYMAWESVAFFAAVLLIEFILLNPNLFTACAIEARDVQDDEGIEEDEDIIAEKKKVENRVAKGNLDMVTICGLRKVFGTLGGDFKVAVRDMNFSVPLGQCFGFLGINGAGKTTTLKMLTGAIYPTRGEAYLNSLNVITQQRRIRKYLGYCPQFDAFIGTLTARETLLMYGHIKGIPRERLDEYVEGIINLLGLKEYADRASGGYSGGNKRKLSVGIALMGNPPMVFLDEPSTGMDPASRRSMWNLIQKTMAKRAVILTTHSMEECEALCQRIGIMVGGRLRCLGSEQHLRHRYGDGYQIDIRIHDQEDSKANDAAVKQLLSWTDKEFKGREVVENQALSLKFRLPSSDLKMSLGGAFEIIEKNKESLKISEYSLSEMSLEQIFIYFARQQREEQGEVAGLAAQGRKQQKQRERAV